MRVFHSSNCCISSVEQTRAIKTHMYSRFRSIDTYANCETKMHSTQRSTVRIEQWRRNGTCSHEFCSVATCFFFFNFSTTWEISLRVLNAKLSVYLGRQPGSLRLQRFSSIYWSGVKKAETSRVIQVSQGQML